ncbi:serine/arginine repetitive matrix protein 1 [Aplysia californica]|uniref:Serine/arginine repetitive matrix protein 1 n=1 Tax=Aplysia californica TaxID=6500 RepID=A0ABM1AET7_APLCA|nr:serine/arginine repetitive matrix protein 1 [Aplysia californica]
MDEVDAVPRPRRQRPKDSFQSELQAKLHQRKSLGLTAEVTDSDDDGLSSSRTKDFMKRGATRPSAAKRRPDHSPDLSRGLGTTTMRARDLSSLLGRSVSDDEDEEVMAANLGKASPGGTWQPGSLKTPSPKQDSLFARKTPTRDSPKEQSGRLESIYGRKTPTKDVSPRSGGLSKEDIIFGRKTPVDGKKSPHDGSLRKLPGVDGGDKPWQPPNFRSASPGSSEHSRGSRGVTPVDATLDTISETPREKVTPRIQRGQKSETSPRALALEDRPKPQARSRVSERKTPPLVDPRRTSPTAQTSKDGALRRASPSFDLFGGRGRAAAAQEVDEYIDKDKQGKEEKLYGGRHALRRSPSPDSKKKELEALGRASPSKQGSGRFSKDGRKTPTDRKTPTGVDRKTPTSFDRKMPSSLDRKTPTSFDRKTPTGQRQKTAEETDKEILQEKAAAMKGSSLLDFLTEDTSQAKPKPQARKNRSRDTADDDLDDIFAANKKLLGKSAEVRRSTEGRKSPGIVGRKSPEPSKRSSASFEDGETPKPRTIPKQQRPEDASSICDEIPLDPNRKVHADTERATRLGKQSSEKAKAEAAIDSIAEAQTMQYIEPAKKVR